MIHSVEMVGAKTYRSDKPCNRGHTGDRYFNGGCVICAKARSREREKRQQALGIKRKRDPEERKRAMARHFAKPSNRERHNVLCRANNHIRKARVRGAGGSYTAAEITALGQRQKWLCANSACKCNIRKKYTVDHIHPIAKGGSNNIRNIQLLCPLCNGRKGAKHPIDWAQQNGMLL